MAKARRTWSAGIMDIGFKIDSAESVKKAVKMCLDVPLMLEEGIEAGTIEAAGPSMKEVTEWWWRQHKDDDVLSYSDAWIQQSLIRAAVRDKYPLEPLYEGIVEAVLALSLQYRSASLPVMNYLATHRCCPEWIVHNYYDYDKLCEKYGFKRNMFLCNVNMTREQQENTLREYQEKTVREHEEQGVD